MISSRGDLDNYIADDLRAAGRSSVPRFCRLRAPSLYFVLRLRKVEFLKNTIGRSPFSKLRYAMARVRLGLLSERLGFSIPLNVFGPGLSIAHTGTIVVNGNARVGSFCRIHPGVTIGATRGLAPRLGDDVFIAPGAGIYGDITVGHRAHIGPNVVVTADVADDTILLPVRAEARESRRGAWMRHLFDTGAEEADGARLAEGTR